jgi:hypothetical protein
MPGTQARGDEVRRLLTIGGVTAALLFSTAGTSHAVVRHHYSGRTSAGSHVEIVTSGRGPELRLRKVSFSTPLRIWSCDDHHNDLGIRGITSLWPRRGLLLGADRSFHRGFSDSFAVYDATGTVGPQHATGTFLLSWVEDEEGDWCTTGSLAWEAHRTTPELRTTARPGSQHGWVRA